MPDEVWRALVRVGGQAVLSGVMDGGTFVHKDGRASRWRLYGNRVREML
jgi:hypothetical protein